MKLSQHFLIDERIADRIVKYADLNENDIVLEIGAGNGILTKRIANISKVIAIEIDKRFIERLRRIKNVEVINADVMKINLENLEFNKVVSNLPYHISSPITFKLLEVPFDSAILMYQKEFAERLVAKPGSKKYGRLSVMAYYKADCEILEYVPKEAFFPKPEVDSCIVKLTPIGKRFNVNEKLFDKVVKALFGHRRKKIKNALLLDKLVEKNEVERLPYMDMRAEQLEPEKIAELCNKIEEIKCLKK